MKKLLYILLGILFGSALSVSAATSVFNSNQIATGTPTSGFVPVSAGANLPAVWTVNSGGTGITNAYASSTFPSFGYASSTFYQASNPNGYTSNTGTVTSVSLTTPTGLSIAGSPITTSGTLALTLTAGFNIPLTASTTNWNNFFNTPSTQITAGTNLSWAGNTLNATGGSSGIFNQATYTVSTTSGSGDFTNVQSAINAATAGSLIHVRCGTYTLPSGVNGIAVKQTGTIIEGEGTCTQFNFDKANTTNAIGFQSTGLQNVTLRNFYIHQTNATFGGIGINASNTPLLYVDQIKIDGTATSTSIKDSSNLSFYQHWTNLDLRDNTSCIDVGGFPVNDNTWDNIRCAPHSGNGGVGLLLDSTNINGAQNNTFINFDVEPTGAATNLSAIVMPTAVNTEFINPYIEGNNVGYNIGANSQRTTFNGGTFVTNSIYTLNAGSTQFLNMGKEGVTINQLMASTSIQDISGSDASVPNLYLHGNNNFARIAPSFKVELNNGSDQGQAIQIINPGTGNSIEATNQSFVLTNTGRIGIGSTTPRSSLSINPLTGVNPFTIGSTTVGAAPTLVVDSLQHIVTNGSRPTALTCGTTPSVTATSSDRKGMILPGSGTASVCTLVFNQVYTAPPTCTFNAMTSAISPLSAFQSTLGTVSTTIILSGNAAGGKITYICEQ